MQKEFASPVEQVLFAGIEMSGSFKLVCRLQKLAVLLVDLAEKIVQFPGVLLPQGDLHSLPRLVKPSAQKGGLSQIVAVVV